jgi:hypothetical protein
VERGENGVIQPGCRRPCGIAVTQPAQGGDKDHAQFPDASQNWPSRCEREVRYHAGCAFRAVHRQVQAIENNPSIANMHFFEFADSADADAIFRGF